MLNEIKGVYIPTAFYMKLNSVKEEMILQDSTFVHEYIHFFQDLLLPYCIRHNLVSVNNFLCVSNVAQKNGKITCPFNEWTDDCEVTFKQQEYTWGIGQGKNCSGKIIDIKRDYFMSPYGHRIYRYILTFDDGSEYQFGARDFLEYLAHKIQNKFWLTNAPDLPYRTIDRIFEYFSLDFVPEEVRLLIVEYCLYNDHPAHFLIKVFIEQKLICDNNEKFRDYNECSKFLLDKGWISNGGFTESIYSKTERRLNDFVQRLSALYQHKNLSSIQQWISDTNAYCKKELSNKFVISSLYNMSKEQMLGVIKEIVAHIGIPLIMFKDNTVTSELLPKKYISEQFVEFYILNSFIGWIMDNKQCGCPVKEICEKNYKLCNAICDIEPAKYQGNCIFRNFLNMYGFDKVIIEK